MLFTIGQVTKMYDISHDTLRYYDKIGVLKPSVKKENGYRYYTIREIELLEMILLAKQLEIPIKDIKGILEKEDENGYIELFKNHKKLLEEKIESLIKLKDEVQHSIDVTTEMKNFTNHESVEMKEEYIDKTIVYFHQNEYGYFNDIMKQKNIIIKTDYSKNQVILDENIIGFELKDEAINESAIHKVKRYKGKYALLTIKDTFENNKNFIHDNINKIYNGRTISGDINIFTESLFMLFKNNKENIYYVKVYIELI